MINTLLKSAFLVAVLVSLCTRAVAGGQSDAEAPEAPSILQNNSLRADYESRALAGDARAASLLADYFLSGDGSQRSAGIYWLRIYSRNTGKASMALGGLLLASERPEEQEEGVAIAKEMAAEGDRPAVLALARFYHSKEDMERAHFWTERAALRGDVSSMIRLGAYLSKHEDNASSVLAATWFLIASSHYSEKSFMAINLRNRADSSMAELDEPGRRAVRNYVTEILKAGALSKPGSTESGDAQAGE